MLLGQTIEIFCQKNISFMRICPAALCLLFPSHQISQLKEKWASDTFDCWWGGEPETVCFTDYSCFQLSLHDPCGRYLEIRWWKRGKRASLLHAVKEWQHWRIWRWSPADMVAAFESKIQNSDFWLWRVR